MPTLASWSELLDDMASLAGVFAFRELQSRGCGWFEVVAPKLDATTWRVALPFLGQPCTQQATEVILSHQEQFAEHVERALSRPLAYVSAVDTIARLGQKPEGLVPMLVAVSRDQQDWERSQNAVRALGYIGNESVAPALESATRGPDFRRALAALEARVRVTENESALREFLQKTARAHYSCSVRAEAEEALGYLDEGRLRLPLMDDQPTDSDGVGARVTELVPGLRRKPFAPGFPSGGHAEVPDRRRPKQGKCEPSHHLLALGCFRRAPNLEGLPELHLSLPDVHGHIYDQLDIPRDVFAVAEWDASTRLLATRAGLVSLDNDGRALLLARGSFDAVVRAHGRLYAATGSMFGGRLLLVSRTGEHWSVSPLLELPGTPLGVAQLGSDLVVAATGGDAYISPDGQWRFVCE